MIGLALDLTCLISVLLRGFIASDGKWLTTLGFRQWRRLPFKEIVGVDVNTKGEFLMRAQVGLRTAASHLVEIPRLQFFLGALMKSRGIPESGRRSTI